MNIYLIRHGETDWNVESRIQGQLNVELNAKGIAQAQEVAKALHGRSFDHVYTSLLARAQKTAEIVNISGLPIKTCPDLNERHFGTWQGRLWRDVMDENPGVPHPWAKDADLVVPPEGESLHCFMERSARFLQFLLRSHGLGENILVVAHGGPIKAMLARALQVPHWEDGRVPRQYNCQINILRYDGSRCWYTRIGKTRYD